LIVVSHRGPSSFTLRDDGTLDSEPSPGGLASGLRPSLAGTGVRWVAAAVSDADRAAARQGVADVDGIDLQLLDLDPYQHRLAYDVVSNGVLWFLHHGLFDLPRRPRFDRRFDEAWDGYRAINRAFADAVAEHATTGDVVLVHDYHLTLVGGMLRTCRPDLRLAFFSHTPFCGPNSIRVLPDRISREMCGALAALPCGFHTARWARAYEASAREVLGAETPLAPSFVAPLGVDVPTLETSVQDPAVLEASAGLEELIGDRKLIARVDRVEPSKNVVRGFLAYDLFLDEHPEWRERVVFLARRYPSRESLPEYLAYRQEVEQAAAQVNERWATRDWTPIVLDTRDSYALSVAALMRFDALVVNPVKDGMNLVAKEGAVLNQRDGVLVLSRDAGAADELAEAALTVNPFDLVDTAAALEQALTMPDDERKQRAQRLNELVRAFTPQRWLDEQVSHAR
jgi:trehalose 6-phosphate synthase